MIPYQDENPTYSPAVVNWLLILVCIVVFVWVQPTATTSGSGYEEQVKFSYRWAAVPCEVTQGRPLAVEEIRATLRQGDPSACRAHPRTPAAFPDKNVWLAVLISMFLHGSWLHLGGNMLFLWIFGNNVEDHLGHLRYLVFYLAAGAVAAVAHFALDLNSTIPVVGASGAIAGVMGAYAVWFPWARVRTVFLVLVIPFFYELPAAALLAMWFLSQFFVVPGSGVAWMAHVGGFVFGALVGLAVRADPRFRHRLWVHQYATLTGAWDNRSGPRAGPPRR